METPHERIRKFYNHPQTKGEEILADLQGMHGIVFTHDEIDRTLAIYPDPIMICLDNITIKGEHV